MVLRDGVRIDFFRSRNGCYQRVYCGGVGWCESLRTDAVPFVGLIEVD